MTGLPRKVRAPDLAQMKARGERIVMLTAYDATMARLLDRAGIDLLLVGDSLGQVILGLDTTIPVTLDAVIHHSRAVARGATRALVVADMPFLTYQVSVEEALRNAGRLIQEGGAAAVKLEGGQPMLPTCADAIIRCLPSQCGASLRRKAALSQLRCPSRARSTRYDASPFLGPSRPVLSGTDGACIW